MEDNSEMIEGDLENVEVQAIQATSGEKGEKNEKPKLVRLPLARVKHIMKLDPDCKLISSDSVFLVTKATELFIQMLMKSTYEITNQAKRKTLMKKDFMKVIENGSNLCFLEGMLE